MCRQSETPITAYTLVRFSDWSTHTSGPNIISSGLSNDGRIIACAGTEAIWQ